MKSKKRLISLLLIMTMISAMIFGTTVSAAKQSVTLNKSKLTLYVGKTEKLKATVKGTKQKPTWKSSKSSVATVKSNGLVTAKKAGKTTITARIGKKTTAKCVVTVKKMNYKKAYADFLAKRNTFSPSDDLFYDASYSPKSKTFVNTFTLIDINKDKTPELITFTNVNFRWQIVRVYTYKNSKVTLMKSFDNCAVANGSYCFEICSKNHIHNNYRGGEVSEQYIYKFDKKVKEYLYYAEYTPFGYVAYQARKNGNAILANEFTKLTKNCKYKKLKEYTNTKYNRTQLEKGKCKVNK